MCVSKHGLVANDIRKLVWPILLNTDVINETQVDLKDDYNWERYAKMKHKDYSQIEKDINRSLNSFDECQKWTKTIKLYRRDQLSKIIHAILNKNEHLHYYQGYHDFVSVFLLTLGENLGFYCADVATNHFIRDFMYKTFEPGVMPALDLTSKLIELIDPELFEMVEAMGG